MDRGIERRGRRLGAASADRLLSATAFVPRCGRGYRRSVKRYLPVALAGVLLACSSSSKTTPGAPDGGLPSGHDAAADAGGGSLEVEGPVTGGKGAPWVAATNFDLAEVGYEQAEYFLEGTARAYAAGGELASDGKWAAVPARSEHFKTRIVVFRPKDAARFNGSVFVEWLNVTGGVDAAADWLTVHVELIRKGYAWVGVSAQKVGVEGGGALLPIAGASDTSLKGYDPERYASLHHPGDTFSYDIFTQAGRLLRERRPVDPLRGLVPARLIGAGESQSAFRMVTYVNAIHPLARVYDGFLVHSRGGGGAALSDDPPVPTPRPAFIREDIGVPVLTFQTETDLMTLGFLPDRQPDGEFVRLWEAAGTAHADTYTLQVGMRDKGDDPAAAEVVEVASPLPGIMDCEKPVNSGPQHFVLKAGLAALEEWMETGNAPPEAPRLSTSGSPAAFELDEHGNVLGGIRTPYVDVPIATHSGLGQMGAGFCGIFGTTKLFDAEKLAALYSTHADYVSKVNAATESAEAAGYLLAPDAELIRAAAARSTIGD